MKITSQTTPVQVAELMGSEASESDGAVMLSLLTQRGITDTDDISESAWGDLLGLVTLAYIQNPAGKLEKAHAVAHAIYLETQRLTQAIQDHRRIALEGSKHSEREAHSALTMLNMRYLAAASAALEDAQREVREAASKL